MAADYELTLNDYLAILRRRWLYILGGFVLIFGGALITAVVVPPVYESTGTILIESQQIPTELVQSAITGFADERIEVIKQRVMTRENLLKIIDKYQLYKDDRKDLTTSELVDELRDAITIATVSADVSNKNKGKSATIAFTLSYQYRHPNETYRVASELVTLFLDENIKSRTERATETTEFLNQEADRLKAELEKVEKQVADYKQQNMAILPQQQEMNLALMQSTQSSLRDVERDYRSTQEELRSLEDDLASAKAGTPMRAGNQKVQESPASELDKLKAEYARLLGTYTENHPSVRAVKRKIDALEKADTPSAPTVAESPAPPANPGVDPAVARVQRKMDAANARLTTLSQQESALRGKLGRLEQQVTQSPSVELGLATLLRDHENAQKKYDEIRAKQMSAQVSENLEQGNKAERFTLIDPPQLSEKPVKPNRFKIILIGFFLAIGGSGGFAFALEMLNQRIWGAEAMTAVLRMHPMVSIPYITLHEEMQRRKKLLKMSALVLISIIVVSALLIHFFYMPLNVLMFKIAARFG